VPKTAPETFCRFLLHRSVRMTAAEIFYLCRTKIARVHLMEFNCLTKEITGWIRAPLENTTVCLESALVPSCFMNSITLVMSCLKTSPRQLHSLQHSTHLFNINSLDTNRASNLGQLATRPRLGWLARVAYFCETLQRKIISVVIHYVTVV